MGIPDSWWRGERNPGPRRAVLRSMHRVDRDMPDPKGQVLSPPSYQLHFKPLLPSMQINKSLYLSFPWSPSCLLCHQTLFTCSHRTPSVFFLHKLASLWFTRSSASFEHLLYNRQHTRHQWANPCWRAASQACRSRPMSRFQCLIIEFRPYLAWALLYHFSQRASILS